MANFRFQLPPFARTSELIANSKEPAGIAVPNEPFIPASRPAINCFLSKELECRVLDELAPYFFVFCKRHNEHVDALHEYAINGLHVAIAEDPGLHLVRKYNAIYIKPIPHCLFNYDFWQTYLIPEDQGDEQHLTIRSDRQNSSRKAQFRPASNEDRKLSITCRSALGLLRSYGYLIKHESDFHIARENNLIPKHVTYTQFQHFIQSFRNIPDTCVSPRYQYGHIRMTRLNMAVRLCRPKALGRVLPWSYHKRTYHSGQYLGKFVPPLLFLFACLTLLLSSMQVGLAAHPSEGPFEVFADVSLWFSVCIVVGIALLGVLIAGGFALYIVNRVVVGLKRNHKWKHGVGCLDDVERGQIGR